jgi:hypothetical protein
MLALLPAQLPLHVSENDGVLPVVEPCKDHSQKFVQFLQLP